MPSFFHMLFKAGACKVPGTWTFLARGGRLTGCQNTSQTDPGEPGYSAQGPNATKAEPSHGSDSDKNCSAGAMNREGVESNADTKHAATGNKDPVCFSPSQLHRDLRRR